MSKRHEKKFNTTNRTTSETLRLSEHDLRATARQEPLISVSNRKKIQSSSSSFQITGVSLTRSDLGDDSADDLDESHTDDISRVTDNETPSFSEDSRDTDDHPLLENASISASSQSVGFTDLPSKLDVKARPPDEDSRFKVVKMPRKEPFNRGRWTCYDFHDINQLNVGIQMVNTINSNYTPPSTNVFVCNRPQIITNSWSRPVISLNHVEINKPTGYSTNTQTLLSLLSRERIGNDNNNVSSSTPSTQISKEDSRTRVCAKTDNQSDIKSVLIPAGKSGFSSRELSELNQINYFTNIAIIVRSSRSSNNIDRKIEDALDAVKTHLMLAIHKEVDHLKSRVSMLEGRVNELEIENSILRVNCLLFKS